MPKYYRSKSYPVFPPIPEEGLPVKELAKQVLNVPTKPTKAEAEAPFWEVSDLAVL